MGEFKSRGNYALNFAPHLGILPGGEGLFAQCCGSDVVDQINFCDANGFGAVEDNFLLDRSVSEQKRIGKALASRDMQMGCFLGIRSLDKPTFGLRDQETRSYLKSEIGFAVAAAQEVGGGFLTIIPGRESASVPRQQQIRNVIDNLKELAPIVESAGLVMVVEAISKKRWSNILVSNVNESFEICNAVNSPAVGVLFDVFQCQRENGDILSTMEACWDQIKCVQIADNPGRMEPGTGEINFLNVLAYLKQRNWAGLVEMEHGLSKPGSQAVHDLIANYQKLSDALSGAPLINTFTS